MPYQQVTQMSEQRNQMVRLAAGVKDDFRRSRGREERLQIGNYNSGSSKISRTDLQEQLLFSYAFTAFFLIQ